jgi:MarR family transcriptional regulator for hemolysin
MDTPAAGAPPEGFARLVGFAARQWRRAIDLRLRDHGLTEATWLPLVRLARAGGPMRQKDLAASLLLDSSSVVRLLDSLQGAGLVLRREDPGDRRAKAIALTPRGRALVRQVEDVSELVRRDVMAGLDEADVAVATRVLREVCQSLVRLTEQEGSLP